MKKIILIVLFFALLITIPSNQEVFADSNSSNQELSQSIEDILGQISFDDYEKLMDCLSEDQKIIFEGDSFLVRVKKLINGEYELSLNSVLNVSFGQVVSVIKNILPVLCFIAVIAIVANLLLQSKSSNASKSVGDIIHFALFSMVVVTLFQIIASLITISTNAVSNIKNQMEVTFPILLTLMASVGSSVSVGVFRPLVAVLSGGLVSFFQGIILPLFIFSIAFNVVGNLSSDVKLNKFCSLFNSLFKTLIGFVFTLFGAFLTIQGISAGSYDGISFKTAKFAIKSSVPFLGSYLSDGLNLIITSSTLVKNAVGVVGLLLLLSTIIQPIIYIIIVKIGLNVLSSVIQPLADKKFSDFADGVAKSLNMLLATLIGISFAYLLTIGLIMCCSNLLF